MNVPLAFVGLGTVVAAALGVALARRSPRFVGPLLACTVLIPWAVSNALAPHGGSPAPAAIVSQAALRAALARELEGSMPDAAGRLAAMLLAIGWASATFPLARRANDAGATRRLGIFLVVEAAVAFLAAARPTATTVLFVTSGTAAMPVPLLRALAALPWLVGVIAIGAIALVARDSRLRRLRREEVAYGVPIVWLAVAYTNTVARIAWTLHLGG